MMEIRKSLYIFSHVHTSHDHFLSAVNTNLRKTLFVWVESDPNIGDFCGHILLVNRDAKS